MKITADTNVLVRTVVQDDPAQATTAQALLQRATIIAVPVPVFCEFAWVLNRTYGYREDEIAEAIGVIVEIETLVTDFPAVDAGLAVLRAGGDFADGVIAYQGERLGGSVFASFDRNAVARLRGRRAAAADPAELIAGGA